MNRLPLPTAPYSCLAGRAVCCITLYTTLSSDQKSLHGVLCVMWVLVCSSAGSSGSCAETAPAPPVTKRHHDVGLGMVMPGADNGGGNNQR